MPDSTIRTDDDGAMNQINRRFLAQQMPSVLPKLHLCPEMHAIPNLKKNRTESNKLWILCLDNKRRISAKTVQNHKKKWFSCPHVNQTSVSPLPTLYL